MCFSVQGIPDFAFNLIFDKYIQLNAQFVLPADDESQTIANVSTFLGDLGLVVKNPKTGNTTVIKISAKDHSVMVDNSLTVVKDKPVRVKMFDDVEVHIDGEMQRKLKDESAWLSVETEMGFSFQTRFYKKHLDLFLTKTSGLTKDAHGLVGKWISANFIVNDYISLNTG